MRIGRAAILVALLAATVAVGQPPVVELPPAVPPLQWQPPPPPPPPAPFPWFVFMPTWIGVLVAVTYAQKQTRDREEEEEVATSADGTEYEYKIIRSPFGAFKKPDKFRAALAEEARVGWQLVEKFDDTRVRLRRPISFRAIDADSGQDPYRIRIGLNDGAIAGRIILGVVLGVAAVVGVLLLVLGGR